MAVRSSSSTRPSPRGLAPEGRAGGRRASPALHRPAGVLALHRLKPRSILLCFVLTALVSAPLAAAPKLTGAQRRAKAAELARLRERIAQTQRQLQAMRGRHDAARAALRQTERRIGHLAKGLRRVHAQLAVKGRKLAHLRTKETKLQARLAEQRKLLAKQIRAAYAIGRQEYIKMLLNQQSPAALGRVVTYYDYFNRARTKRIHAALDTLEQLDTVKHAIIDARRKLRALQGRQRHDKRDLEATYHQRAAAVAHLDAQIHTKAQQLARMKHNEQALQTLLNALRDVLADIPAKPGNRKPFRDLKGQLAWPVRGHVERLFGRRQLGQLRWNGVIIRAPEGRKVRAISHGRVAFADWLRGYGLLIIIDHGNGYMSLYGHNQSLYKETGDWVEPGDVIATVGDSGGQSKAGLYFEIRHDGRPVNPTRWCSAANSAELSAQASTQ